ncbi:unnamed protein product [Rhizoctonia solani]|uniref:CHAT domain-containing protein n=1 Tax=Rhizoctonia solani TaxID=456999 RepID=A0A8H2Y1M5_9AGAM|nr:unnamed protein product [Rhizoctonia solani]
MRKLGTEDGAEINRLIKRADQYFYEFERSGKLDDLEEAIECSVKLISLTPDWYPDLHVRLASLSVMYYTRFQNLGNLEDLDKDIDYSLRAFSLTPKGHPRLAMRVGSLATSHLERFQQLDNLSDLDKAIEYSIRAHSLTPDGHPDQPERLGQLGASHHERFLRLDDLNALEKGIEYREKALSLIPEGHPDRPEHLGDLESSYYDRFIRFGNLNDLNKALEYLVEEQSCIPEGDSVPPHRLSGMAAIYFTRFQHLGELDDLDKAIEYDLKARSLTPEGHTDLPDRLDALGASYHERFMRLGDLSDIDKAIEYRHEAHTLTPEVHPGTPERLSALGISYHERYVRLGNLGDLEQAIKYKNESYTLTPKGHPDLPDRLSSLGTSYHHRFNHLSDRGDLEKAIEYEIQAYSLTPEDHSHVLRRLENLGTSYHERFVRYRNTDDLHEGIKYNLQAYKRTPEGHPDVSHCLSNLGKSYEEKFAYLGELNDLNQALEYYQRSSCSVAGHPQLRFGAALDWARLAFDQNVPSYLQAYQIAIELIPEVIWIGTTVNQRYATIVRQLSGLATEAASVAIMAGQPKLALEWLEQGRSIVWNQTLLLQSPLDELGVENSSIVDQFRDISNRLQSSTQGRSAQRELPIGNDLSQLEQVAQQRHQLAKQYTELMSQVRQLPGFENFLRPRPSNELMLAAQTGPIVVINVDKTRCDALILRPGGSEVEHLALTNFTYQKAQDSRTQIEFSLGRSGARERADRRPLIPETDFQQDFVHVLATLWDDVAKPVLTFLGYLGSISHQDLPHITWCTTGPLAFLPLHAAGYYDQPRARLSDYAISSYTPTLTALLSSVQSGSYSHSSIVAIGQEETSGFSSLPGTRRELEYIKKHAGDQVKFKQLTDDAATPAVVLDLMEQCDWVHLACHAHQSITDPTQSGFFLYKDILDLSTIMQKSFKNKGLAFLSACQTATGDKALADEAVHLASCMLVAGYPSVIATMWAVRDSDAPFVADKVYGMLLKAGEMSYRDAARALHYAVEELKRDLGDDKFECWAPFIHIGF